MTTSSRRWLLASLGLLGVAAAAWVFLAEGAPEDTSRGTEEVAGAETDEGTVGDGAAGAAEESTVQEAASRPLDAGALDATSALRPPSRPVPPELQEVQTQAENALSRREVERLRALVEMAERSGNADRALLMRARIETLEAASVSQEPPEGELE